MSHRGPGKTYPSADVRWESDSWVTCLWETINAVVLGSSEFLCCKSPLSLILSYHVTLCYHAKVSLKYKFAFKKIRQAGRLFPNSYMWISLSNKLQQAKFFVKFCTGFVLTWSLTTTIFSFFLFCLFHLYIMVRRLYRRNPGNFPILCIDSVSVCALPRGPSRSLGLLCSISYPQTGATSSFA